MKNLTLKFSLKGQVGIVKAALEEREFQAEHTEKSGKQRICLRSDEKPPSVEAVGVIK